MTPEERAKQVVERWERVEDLSRPYYRDCIADAIRAAVQAEREACAQLALEEKEHWYGNDDMSVGVICAQNIHAAIIRARTAGRLGGD